MICALAALATIMPGTVLAAPTGAGTDNDPYVVNNWDDLKTAIIAVSADLTQMHYIELAGDIDNVTGATFPSPGGGNSNEGKITIDGKGFSLKADSPATPNTGLRFKGNSANDNALVLRNITFENLQNGGAGGTGTSTYNYGGGAISYRAGNLTIENCNFINNQSVVVANNAGGGAVYLQNAGTVIVDKSSFSGNLTAAQGGGAIRIGNAAAVATITDSVFEENKALSSTGGGGAVYLAGSGSSIANSTFYGNESRLDGGAIYFASIGTVKNSTIIANNVSFGFGGGISGQTPGSVTLYNSIVSANSALIGPAYKDVYFTTDGGNNLIGEDVSDFLESGAPKDNGGPTATIALLRGSNSPALDKVPFNDTNLTTTDQRGNTRNAAASGTAADIGAFELQASDTVGTTPSGTPPSGSGGSGGCDAGAGTAALMLAGAAMLITRRRED